MQAGDAQQSIKEIAALLVSTSDTYLRIRQLLDDPGRFDQARREALSLSMMSSQLLTTALENMHQLRSQTERQYHPPLMALLILGALGSSCTLIAAAGNAQKLNDVTLLSARYLQAVLELPEVDGWLKVCLQK